MGFSVSWMAIKGKQPEEVRETLEFIETNERQEFPDAEFSASKLAGDWYLIYINRCDSPYVSSETLELLSTDCEIIACVVEEHVMYSRSQYWDNGNKVWQVMHDAQQGMLNLEHEGPLPVNFENIRMTSFAEQDAEGGEESEVDYIFEIPLILADSISGFKHDEIISGLEYTVLISNRAANKQGFGSWWKFW